MNDDYIDRYEKNVRTSWFSVIMRIVIAVALILAIYYSILPIKEQVDYYNTFVNIGQCLCPAENYGLIP